MKFITSRSTIEDYQEGELISYPCDDLKFIRMAEINETIARGIINLYPKARHFINKLAIILSVEKTSFPPKVTAVYQHDFRFWIIQKTF